MGCRGLIVEMALGGVLATLLSPAAASAAKHPNIIYINADDLGVMDVGFMGRAEYKTPNLDRLAAEGMVFTQAYAPSANCAPSRACCLSGQYTPRHGVYTVDSSERGDSRCRKIVPIPNTLHLSDEDVLIPEALKAAGYKTIHLGKWHVGEDPTTQGIDVNIGGDANGHPLAGYFAPFKKGAMKAMDSLYPAGTHMDDVFADQAVKFMSENKDHPFFMYMAYYSVHTPLQPVPEFVDSYQGVPGINARYASMIEKMDQSIGKILDGLDALGLKENTLVLFSSDNGGVEAISSQRPYRAGKGSYFDGGTRVPLTVRWPGHVAAGSRCETPVVGLDFFPTFLEVAGVPAPAGKVLDGQSLVPLLMQEGSFAERAIFWHFPIYLQSYKPKKESNHDPLFRTRPGSSVRMGNWKLQHYYEDGRNELYNLKDDMGELNDISAQQPEKTQELFAMLTRWIEATHAPVPCELNPDYDESVDLAARTAKILEKQ